MTCPFESQINHYLLSRGAYVFGFVCLLPTLLKNYEWIAMKFYGGVPGWYKEQEHVIKFW